MTATTSRLPAVSDHLASPSPSAIHASPLLRTLGQSIRPVRVGLLYRVALFLVALTMLTLPLIYVALIAGVGYVVYLHAVHDTFLMGGRAGTRISARLFIFQLVLYLAPMVVGGILVLFMIKPLFSRRRVDSVPLSLSEHDQPLLHAFIRQLADAVRAPRPKRIHVDCRVNASAGFTGGIIGFIRGDLALTIGLPLVAGLDFRQLAGVLAHELGHFAQGGGMRITYVIRAIDGWFARVVYERDQWDDQLVETMRSGAHWSFQLVAMLAICIVWLTRKVLFALMMIGHAVSAFMLRQMEFDADRYEARVAGSGAFQQTSGRLIALNVASSAAFSDLGTAWQERRLCDDLTQLVRNRDEEMPAEVRSQLNKLSGSEKTGWFDTHPCDADRIAAARRENAPGIIAVEAPAAALFNGFDETSRLATMRFYLDVLGNQVRPEHVFPTETLIASRGQRRQSYAALQRYFQDLVSPRLPVFPRAHIPPTSDEAAVAEQILEARTQFQSLAPDAAAAVQPLERIDQLLLTIAVIKALRSAGVRKIVVEDKQLAAADDTHLRSRQRQASAERDAVIVRIDAAMQPGLRRLELALAIDAARSRPASPPADAGDFGEYELNEPAPAGSIAALLETLAHLRGLMRLADDLVIPFNELSALLAQVQPNESSEHLVGAIMSRSRRCNDLMAQMRTASGRLTYPYEHAEGSVSLARFLLPQITQPEQVGAVTEAADATLNACYGLYMRILSDLVTRAEQIESEFGLPPLEIIQTPSPSASK